MTKFFITFWQKSHFLTKNGGTTKTNYKVHWYQVLVYVYGKCLVVNIRSMTKKIFALKTHVLPKMLNFLKIMSQTIFFLLIQAPNMSKHISRNRRATIKASRKTAHNKVFLFWDKKAITLNKVIARNLYIGTNVLVYERWLVLKVWYTASWPNTFAIAYACESKIKAPRWLCFKLLKAIYHPYSWLIVKAAQNKNHPTTTL